MVIMASPRPTPKVVRLGVDTVARGHDLDEVAAGYRHGGYLGGGETDEVREEAANDGGVPDDKKIVLLTLELDDRGLKANYERDGKESHEMAWMQ